MASFTEPVLHEALAVACEARSLPSDGARLVHHYSNAVFTLPGAGVVVRLTTSPSAAATIANTQVAVGRLVAEHGFPATAPLDGVAPVRLDSGLTASFWRYYPQEPAPRDFTAADLAALLRTLHSLPDLGLPLPRWKPLTGLRGELDRPGTPFGLSADEARWLRGEAQAVCEALEAVHWPLGIGLIHADAWAGNLLWDSDGPILGDWDGLAVGPREIDLIPTWHAGVRYGYAPGWVPQFCETYGFDLATEPAYDLLLRMRDLVQLKGPLRRAADSAPHLAALRQRFEAIRSGNTVGTWVGL